MRRDPEKGPEYPALGAGVAKWRRLAHEGLSTLTYKQRRDYGLAVLAAIGALQRRELQACLRPTPSTTYSIPRCADKAVNDHKPLYNGSQADEYRRVMLLKNPAWKEAA